MSDYYQLMNVIAIGLCHCWKAGKAWLTPGSGCYLLWVWVTTVIYAPDFVSNCWWQRWGDPRLELPPLACPPSHSHLLSPLGCSLNSSPLDMLLLLIPAWLLWAGIPRLLPLYSFPPASRVCGQTQNYKSLVICPVLSLTTTLPWLPQCASPLRSILESESLSLSGHELFIFLSHFHNVLSAMYVHYSYFGTGA